ncbi:MAG TPA: O-antigen ligase family protein [Patescibacteria group bacterium]
MANLNILEKLVRLLLILFIFLLFAGQLTKISLPAISGAIYLNDVILFLMILVFSFLVLFERRKLLFPVGFFPLLFFNLSAFISLVYSLGIFETGQVLIGALFWLRWVTYGFVYLIIVNLLKKDDLKFFNNLIILVGVLVALLGFVQLVIFPDLTFLTVYGYDPHIKRLASTFFDPNFSGIFLNLILVNLLVTGQNKKSYNLPLILIIFTAIILTFSRSAYLSLLTGILIFGLFFSKRFALGILVLFIISTFTIPKIQERLLGAANVDVTAMARIESWENALTIFKDNPTFGIGFNNYRFAQAKYGFFDVDEPLGGHSGAGSDSSFLTTLATTGIFGFLFFIVFWVRIVKFLKNQFKKNVFAKISLISLATLLVGSQFINALYYPWIIAVVWITIGFANIASHAKK